MTSEEVLAAIGQDGDVEEQMAMYKVGSSYVGVSMNDFVARGGRDPGR